MKKKSYPLSFVFLELQLEFWQDFGSIKDLKDKKTTHMKLLQRENCKYKDEMCLEGLKKGGSLWRAR